MVISTKKNAQKKAKKEELVLSQTPKLSAFFIKRNNEDILNSSESNTNHDCNETCGGEITQSKPKESSIGKCKF